MAGTYGEPGKNSFTVKGVGGVLSPVVNDTTGVTQIYRQGPVNTFQSIGTYNPSTKQFTAGPNTTDAEKRALSSENGLSSIRNSASITVSKGVQAAGGTPESAKARANSLITKSNANEPGITGDTSRPSGSGVESSDQTRNEFPNLRYPEDIGSTKQDIIKFTMLQYQPSGLSSGGEQGLFAVGQDRKAGRNGIGSVILPIPSGISDSNSVQWGSENMNAFEAFMNKTALDTITKGFEAGAANFQKPTEPESKEAKTGIANVFAAAATGTAGAQILARTEGAVLNPNMELLFQGPALRPFNFTFKMSARSEKEAKQIIGIIRFFKQGMAVQKSKANLFLKAPHTFRIQYIHRPKGQNADHPYIGKIKECALQSLVVNYTPEGQYATYRDGVLVSYEMQMTFQELEPIFNEDSGKGTGSGGPDTDLGY